MTVTYTTKPGEFANSYHATVGDLDIVLEKIANEYLSWNAFITSTAEGVDGRTVELNSFENTLSASKARVLAFHPDQRGMTADCGVRQHRRAANHWKERDQ